MKLFIGGSLAKSTSVKSTSIKSISVKSTSVKSALLCLAAMSPMLAEAQGEIDEIVVKSSPLHKKQNEMAQFSSVLDGDRLREEVASNLGDTLAGQVGVSAATFGPNVGRPVIRGQGGDRVRVLQDGTGTLDVSTISPDHAVGTEAILAESIEIIRGPNTLIYGSGAIGGVVNVIDNRIPDQTPLGLKGGFEQRHSTVADENTSVVKLDAGGEHTAWHLDGFYRRTGVVEIPGAARVDADEDEPRGIVENSNSRAKGLTLGGSLIDGENFIGAAVSRLENNYGIPPGAHEHHDEHEEGEEEEDEEHEAEVFARIEMEQTRYELKGRLMQPLAGFERLSAKLTYNDYRHVELEGSEQGTVFDNEAFEGRLELAHRPIAGVHGVAGLQWLERDFAAVGDEAFVPPSDISSQGVFLIQDLHRGDWIYEWGARWERQQIDTSAYGSRDDDALSLSGSAVWNLSENTLLSAIVSRSQRTPAVEELFSNGFHVATNTYEAGNVELDRETALNMELSWRQQLGSLSWLLSLYRNDFADFIYERASGEVFDLHDEEILPACPQDEECIAVYRFTQQDAVFRGLEFELTLPLATLAGEPIEARLFGDYVRAELDSGEDIPRLPPMSYGLELRHDHQLWSIFLRATIAEEQKRPGANESITEGYERVDAGASYYISSGRYQHTLFLKATNLLDREIRNATSFLRDLAPEPGRSFVVGYRLEF